MMEKLRRLKRRVKNYGEDPEELAKLYESLQHGRMEEMDQMGPKERLMMELVKEGDMEQLKEHLEEFPNLNINVRDRMGRFPLQIAVSNQDTDMVWYIIHIEDKEVMLGDALLHAVDMSNEHITSILLDWQKRKEENGQIEESMESSDFPSHITPLVLACKNNDYGIIRLLLEKDFKLKDIKSVEHSVQDIPCHARGETLEIGRARVDEFRAKASTVYICLTSEDPILTAFYLIEKADKLAYNDPIFKKDYDAISESCREFTAVLLDECRTSEEVELVLKKKDPHNTGVAYPRLKLALDKGIKEFVTHENCQQVMKNLWTKGHSNIMRLGFWSMFFHFVPHLLLLPFVYIGYYFFPILKMFDMYHAPMMKFFGDCASYIVFLTLLYYDSTHRPEADRVPEIVNAINFMLVIYIACFTWETLQSAYRNGLHEFSRDIWLANKLIMCVLFIGSYVCSIVSYAIVSRKGEDYKNEERFLWHWTDPVLIAESFYCIGILVAFSRILYPFQISQFLGPVQLYIKRMVSDVLQTLFIFLVMLLSFSMALTRLLTYYGGMTRIEDGELQQHPESFQRFAKAFKTLFWDMFGYGDVDAVDVVVRNTCEDQLTQCFNTTKHRLTELTGYSLYALYHIMAIIILVNALIALMSNTLSKVQENLDQEWKFDRSNLWMKYFERRRVFPTPLFLLPSPHDVYFWIKWCRTRRTKHNEARFMFDKCCYFVDEEKKKEELEREEEKFPLLMNRLIARYLSRIEEKEEAKIITYEDLEEAKQDLLKEISVLSQGRRKSLWKRPLLSKVVEDKVEKEKET